jgi:hypothetical protein
MPRIRSLPRVMEWPKPGSQQSHRVSKCFDFNNFFPNERCRPGGSSIHMQPVVDRMMTEVFVLYYGIPNAW